MEVFVQTLHLEDPGGAWEKHNGRLQGQVGPVTVVAQDGPCEAIILTRANHDEGMWAVRPTALTRARSRG
jgi:hypothetical protein